MIFVDTTKGKTCEQFGYTSKCNEVEYVEADVNCSQILILRHDGEAINTIYYEDIPKLILALQAAYDFKFKESQ
jgi:hypothetical protein